MACSVCRKTGHTKRNCPKLKAEKIQIQRDRFNMLISVFPALISNPILMALLWWQLSKFFPNFQFVNKLIIGAETFDFFSPYESNLTLPEGVVLGALIMEAENSEDYLKWLKKKVASGEEIISQHGYETGQTVGRLWEWFTTQDPFSEFGSPSGVGN